MDKKIGLSSFRAFSNAVSPHGSQFTGLSACCRRYGLFSLLSALLAMRLQSNVRRRPSSATAIPESARKGKQRARACPVPKRPTMAMEMPKPLEERRYDTTQPRSGRRSTYTGLLHAEGRRGVEIGGGRV